MTLLVLVCMSLMLPNPPAYKFQPKVYSSFKDLLTSDLGVSHSSQHGKWPHHTLKLRGGSETDSLDSHPFPFFKPGAHKLHAKPKLTPEQFNANAPDVHPAEGPKPVKAPPSAMMEPADHKPLWYSFVMRKEVHCSAFDHRKILIAVVTSPGHVTARDVIRNTWARDAAAMGISVKFFVGLLPTAKKDLETKLSTETDIVRFDDFEENYHNLVDKAIDIFSYAHDQCFSGVFKVDDDTLVRVPQLLSFLSQHELDNLYSGYIVTNAPVLKNPQGRWFAYDQYPHDYWPTFANGPAFFLGRRALDYISQNRNSLNRIRTDDPAVGVWTQNLGMNIVEMPSSFFEYTPKTSVVFQNPLEADEMLRAYKGEVFVPRACQSDQQFACRCSGHPQYHYEEIPRCWETMGNTPYTDSTLRL